MPSTRTNHSYKQTKELPQPGRDSWGSLTQEKRAEYIENYAPLIRYIADRLALRLPNHISREDLISSGVLGLIDAIDKFNPERKILFKTYAEFRIKGAILDELRSMDWVPRSVRRKSNQMEKAYQNLEGELGRAATDEEVAGALGLSIEAFHRLLDEVKSVNVLSIDSFFGHLQDQNRNDLFDLLTNESSQDPLTVLNMREIKSILARTIEKLPKKEKLVVSMYYYEELTMKEIGEALDYTESRISQLHTKAIARLRARLRSYFETLSR
ncbi:MAG: FliA/WhiG family RNA polymerase sigma factor [Deltaproteobacteria bacterium]|nr:FliA/WhiG family RNA polymerase sigma factor [Deltaproteobacteria bacterium]MBW2050826.1 FliA/WhiG family RNA polymerase sigma factor [Deltaproteobacteria bacterium]MBW2140050.1 FliA/WhiG family RNA polymerase sigma factor [Deltaproteobacteria bacterium]MBW2322084.1 FliA/WhiG family RNA polymerase sigma factor [Deltaproteobacteria bacterium]